MYSIVVSDYDTYVKKAKSNLVGYKKVVKKIVYEGSGITEMKNARTLNVETVDKLFENGANIYAIWTKKKNGKKWCLKYIGQRKEKYCRQRVNQHLFNCPARTESKLAKVRKELERGNEVGVSVIHVIPDVLRRAIEESIIQSLDAEWNTHK